MQVALRHTSTGRTRFIGTGWSWSIFLGAGFLGLPLFFRGLALWGTVMVVAWFAELSAPFMALGDSAEWLVTLAVAGLCLYLGFRGNALSARHFIACGYDFARPNSAEARLAAERWGL